LLGGDVEVRLHPWLQHFVLPRHPYVEISNALPDMRKEELLLHTGPVGISQSLIGQNKLIKAGKSGINSAAWK